MVIPMPNLQANHLALGADKGLTPVGKGILGSNKAQILGFYTLPAPSFGHQQPAKCQWFLRCA